MKSFSKCMLLILVAVISMRCTKDKFPLTPETPETKPEVIRGYVYLENQTNQSVPVASCL